MLSVPDATRIPLGTVQVAGQKFELFLSPEWARYFQSLNGQVVAHGATLAESAAHTTLLGEAMEAPDVFPGPPGQPGMQGAPGLALFMLQDDARDEPLLVPPSVDGVYVPLNSKDASGGVPGLTQFRLNLKNAAGTVTSWFTTAATAARTWTMPDKDGTVAVLSDFAAPPAIGNTTAASGAFTTLTANTFNKVGLVQPATGSAIQIADQCTFKCNNNITLAGNDGTTLNILAGGTLRDSAFMSSTSFASAGGAGADWQAGKFGCNGKTPQAAAASGGTLAGVIAALVANGILSS